MDIEVDFGAHADAGVRRAELRRLTGLLDGQQPRSSRIVEVAGDPGTGKTWLLTAIQREARRRGLVTMSGQCSESERGIPLHAFAPVLDAHIFSEAEDGMPSCFSEVPPVPSDSGTQIEDSLLDNARMRGEQERFSVYRAVRRLITRRSGGGAVLVLDDFHWADPSSVELLSYLVRWPVEAPLLLVIGERPRQASAVLHSALAQGINARAVERIRLGPLSVGQCAELLGARLPDPRVERLHQESGGNPLYLLMLAKGQGDRPAVSPFAGPPGHQPPAHDLTISEISRLSSEEWQVTAAVVVLGDDADTLSLATVTGLSVARTTSVVNRLMRRDLLRPAAAGRVGGIDLRHPALRHLLYQHFDREWLVTAHRTVAQVLARRGASAGRQAAHVEFSLLPRDEQGARVLVHGAREVMDSDPLTAVRWLSLALRTEEEQSRHSLTPCHLEVSYLLARALGLSGQLVESRRLLRRLLLLLPDEHPRLRAATAAFCALVEGVLGHYTEAQALLDGQRGTLGAVPFAEAVDLLMSQVLVWLLGGRLTGAPEGEPLPEPGPSDPYDPLAEAGLLTVRAAHAVRGNEPADGQRLVRESGAVLDGLSDVTLARRPQCLLLLGVLEMQLDRYTDAKRHFRRGTRIVRTSGQLHLLPLMLIGRAAACTVVGTLSEARRAAMEAQEAARRTGARPLQHTAVAIEPLGAVWAGKSEWDCEWLQHVGRINDAVSLLPMTVSPWNLGRAWSMANTARTTGDPRCVITTLVETLGGDELPELPLAMRPAFLEILAHAATVADDGPSASASTWADLALSVAQRLPEGVGMAYAFGAAAHVHRSREEYEAAFRMYQRSAELFTRAELTVDRLRMTVLGASAAARAGLAGEADRMLRAARQLAQGLGAYRLLGELGSMAAHEPQGAPQIPAAEHGATPAGTGEPLRMLTARERDVANLAATGMQTKEIASELLLSPRTVGVHLTHIYQKLQVRSRSELVRFMTGLENRALRLEPRPKW